MSESRVAVTGATGFLGRALVEQLIVGGVAVRAITRGGRPSPGAETIQSDIRDADRLAKAFRGVDAVFHLAAHVHDLRSADDSVRQEAVTLGGTLAVLNAAERAGVGHVVFASSLAVFGPVGNATVNEEHPCRPDTPYGRAKLEAEAALVEFTARTGAFGSCIRPAMMYGPHGPGNLPRLIRALNGHWRPSLPEFGNRRSMIAVSDTAAAMMLAWRAKIRGGRAYIVTDGETYSTRRIADMIQHALGRRASRVTLPRAVFTAAARIGDLAGEVLGRRAPFDSVAFDRITGSACFDASRARRELGFAPTLTLADALPAIVREVVSRDPGHREHR